VFRAQVAPFSFPVLRDGLLDTASASRPPLGDRRAPAPHAPSRLEGPAPSGPCRVL